MAADRPPIGDAFGLLLFESWISAQRRVGIMKDGQTVAFGLVGYILISLPRILRKMT